MRSGRQNVMNPTKGEPYLVVGGAGNSFTMSHAATRGSARPYMDFKLFVTSVPGGGGVMPLYGHMGGVYPYMGLSYPPRVFGVHNMSPSLLLSLVFYF